MDSSNKTKTLVLAALMTGMIIVMTMIIKIPIPFTQGYVHLGDAMIFMAVLVVGWKYGAAAAGIGSALADLMLGAAMWAPWTLVVKGGMAIIMGLILKGGRENITALRQTVAMICGGLFMVAGYYVAEGVMYGNWIAPAIGVPWNIGQFAVGGIIATILAAALCRTSASKLFEYKMRTN